MTELSLRCDTPSCMKLWANEAETRKRCISLPRVYDATYEQGLYPGSIARCEGCGGYSDGKTWWHRCATCRADVEPGTLTGLFVPHNCRKCESEISEKNRASGNVCSLCGKPRNQCCC